MFDSAPIKIPDGGVDMVSMSVEEIVAVFLVPCEMNFFDPVFGQGMKIFDGVKAMNLNWSIVATFTFPK